MEEIKKIIEQFESGLVSAGVRADNVDYDILAEVRTKCWNDLKTLIENK